MKFVCVSTAFRSLLRKKLCQIRRANNMWAEKRTTMLWNGDEEKNCRSCKSQDAHTNRVFFGGASLSIITFFIKAKPSYSLIIIVITIIIIIMFAMDYTSWTIHSSTHTKAREGERERDRSKHRHWNGKWKYIIWELTWITCVLFDVFARLNTVSCRGRRQRCQCIGIKVEGGFLPLRRTKTQ